MPPGPKGADGAGGSAHVHSINPTMRVMALVIPGFLTLSVAYVLYAVADYVLMKQYYNLFDKRDVAIGLVVTYSIIAALMVLTYIRLFITIQTNPGVVALGPESARDFYNIKRKAAAASAANVAPRARGDMAAAWDDLRASFGGKRGTTANNQTGNSTANKAAALGSDNDNVDLEAGRTNANTAPNGGIGSSYEGTNAPAGRDPRLDPDSPGLENFYTRDVFECTADGRPIWCSPCGAWKPDRAHHCSEIGRCVRKMDHFCPWVGGIVSETTFKFFVQFTFYASLLCALTIGTCASALSERKKRDLGSDGRTIAALALAAVLGMFSFAMFLTCFNFVLRNLTTVESHQLKDRVKMMAVRVQQGSAPVVGRYNVVTYPLPKDPELLRYGLTYHSPQTGGVVLPKSQATTEPSFTHVNATSAPGATTTQPEDSEGPDPFKINREARAARRQAREARDARDLLAFRSFAIISVPKGMHVWNLGIGGNWVSVMGSNPFDWLLPFRHSPCCSHDSTKSFYKVNPKFLQYCKTLDLPPCQEMEQVRH
ncbi:Palmitoyltransferase pfa5 [Sporothrix stenoceras]|uniref:Palmitoyltransferase n=1 Tax=Sporothrix stenoceras TaxID=5173 RepID=A0ABR3YIU1_9PEZI